MAPLTSMYYFGARDPASPSRARPDDWRTAVHDSAGLAGLTGRGQRVWRPLINPPAVQVSEFPDAAPRGFGLMQRQRAFGDFGDLQVLYGRRPDLWIEPIGDWGAGAVDLVEIPTSSEYNDNIVAFWRGREPLRAGAEYSFTYRMHWGIDPAQDARLTRVVDVRTGAGTAANTRVFVLDLSGEAIKSMLPDAKTWLDLATGAGELREGYSGPNPETNGWRISLEFDPAGATVADLRSMHPCGRARRAVRDLATPMGRLIRLRCVVRPETTTGPPRVRRNRVVLRPGSREKGDTLSMNFTQLRTIINTDYLTYSKLT